MADSPVFDDFGDFQTFENERPSDTLKSVEQLSEVSIGTGNMFEFDQDAFEQFVAAFEQQLSSMQFSSNKIDGNCTNIQYESKENFGLSDSSSSMIRSQEDIMNDCP